MAGRKKNLPQSDLRGKWSASSEGGKTQPAIVVALRKGKRKSCGHRRRRREKKAHLENIS